MPRSREGALLVMHSKGHRQMAENTPEGVPGDAKVIASDENLALVSILLNTSSK